MSDTKNKAEMIKKAADKALMKKEAIIGKLPRAARKWDSFGSAYNAGRKAGERAAREAAEGSGGAGMGFVNDFTKQISEGPMNIPKMVGVMVAALSVGKFVDKMIEYGKEKHLELQKPKYYRSMIKANPALLEEDPEEVMDLWNTLWHNSPHMAQDPVAAGGFITQNIQGRVRTELGGPPIDTYSTLNKIESDSTSSRKRRLESNVDLTDALIAGLGFGS